MEYGNSMEKLASRLYGLWLLPACFLLPFLGGAQPAEDSLLAVIPGAFQTLAVDPLQQIYLSAPEALVKLSPAGEPLFHYSNQTLGPLRHLDASNPFSLLLYYEAFQTVVLLDRTLAERGRLDLRQTELRNPTAIARSNDDNIWVYDDWDYRLYKISPSGEILLRSDDLRLLLGLNAPCTLIAASGTLVYLNFPGRGVAVFTNYGQFKHWLELPGIVQWWWAEDRFVYLDTQGFGAYHPESQRMWPLPFESAIQPLALTVQSARVYRLWSDRLEIRHRIPTRINH
jgi:hypothetical protein